MFLRRLCQSGQEMHRLSALRPFYVRNTRRFRALVERAVVGQVPVGCVCFRKCGHSRQFLNPKRAFAIFSLLDERSNSEVAETLYFRLLFRFPCSRRNC